VAGPGLYGFVNNAGIGSLDTTVAGSDAEFERVMAVNLFGPCGLHTPDRSMYPQPDDVSAAVKDALFSPTPKRRYLVCPNEQEVEAVIYKQHNQLVQLNEGQRYTYDRQSLIRMLDEMLKGARPRTN